eukprot:4830415-Pyramimonas_sp.AAC.1
MWQPIDVRKRRVCRAWLEHATISILSRCAATLSDAIRSRFAKDIWAVLMLFRTGKALHSRLSHATSSSSWCTASQNSQVASGSRYQNSRALPTEAPLPRALARFWKERTLQRRRVGPFGPFGWASRKSLILPWGGRPRSRFLPLPEKETPTV